MSSTEQQATEDKNGWFEQLKGHLKTFAGSGRNLTLILTLAMVASIIWGVANTWELVRGSRLISKEETATLVQMDLLQFFAFIVAWSAVLMTVSAWITNWLIKEHSTIERMVWERERMAERYSQHVADHPDIESRMKELEDHTVLLQGQFDPLMEETENLRKENQSLRMLNERLVKLVAEESRKSLY